MPQGGPKPKTAKQPSKSQLSARDKSYLDAHYDTVSTIAKDYDVDPVPVWGVGIESGFASAGTYLRTGDAFGMTGGNTKHMTVASSPIENTEQFFDRYGRQIRGAESNVCSFIDALKDIDASGKHNMGWKTYNSENPYWRSFIEGGTNEMRRSIPTYLFQKKKEATEAR